MYFTPGIIVQQPFATLIVLGFKREEYLAHDIRHRGRLMIQAGQAPPVANWDTRKQVARALKAIQAAGFESFADLPRGVVIGAVNLVDVKEHHGGGLNRFRWILTSPEMFSNPGPGVRVLFYGNAGK